MAGAVMTAATVVVFVPSGTAAVAPPVTALAACTAPAWAEGATYAYTRH
jgi:hypothetical protein